MNRRRLKLKAKDFLQYLDLTPDGVMALRGQTIIFVNQAFVKMMRSTSPSRYIGRSVLEIMAPEGIEDAKRALKDQTPGGVVARGDGVCLREDGTRIVIEFAGQRFGDDDDPITLYIDRDVTEARAQVEELRRADEERGRMFESGPIAVTFADLSGRYLHANSAMCNLVGYSEAELCTRTYLDLTYPADRLAEVEAMRKLVAGELEVRLRKRFLRRDNEIVDVSAQLTLLHHADGGPRGYLAHIVDNTAETKAATALRNAEQQFRTLFAGAKIPMGLTSFGVGRGYLQRANPAMCKFYGYREEELLSLSVDELTHPDEREMSLSRLDVDRLRIGDRYRTTRRYKHKSGEWIEAERFVTVIPDGQGKPGEAIVQLLDVRRRREAERALKKSRGAHRMMMQHMPRVLIITYDLNLRYTQLESGPEMLAATNLSRESVVGKHVREVARRETADKVEQILLRSIQGESVRWPHRRENRTFDCHSKPMRDKQGEIVGGMTLFYETTPELT